MKVKLLDYQKEALELLLYTKNTRLRGKYSYADIKKWSKKEKDKHLAYMKDTLKSSWEFVNYVIEISEVTRSFTHQLVRTRTASYAQESQRALDMSQVKWSTPDSLEKDLQQDFNLAVIKGIKEYKILTNKGASYQDARGVLPQSVHTSIIMGVNLRTLHQMAEVRLCSKTQGEYQEVFKLVKKAIVRVHPWTEEFLQVYCVNHGICCFPRTESCPIKPLTVSVNVTTKNKIKKKWEKNKARIIPKASKEGVTKS